MSEDKFKIEKNDKSGRYLVANNDLESGELIFTDKPFVIGPKSDTPPLCLGCYYPYDGTYVCSKCAWPCCNQTCENLPQHSENECSIFSSRKIKFQKVDDYTASCVQLDCITPLRMLLAKEREPERWSKEVEILETHSGERKQRPTWEADEVNIAKFLVDHCKLSDRFDTDMVQKTCGILEVNAVEIPTRGGFSVRAIYPQLSLIAHNCVPNITHTILQSSGNVVQIRAATHIKQGERLHLCYTHALSPTLVRREHLKESKFFDCDCDRCKDPSELGTHLSTLKCNKCDNGIIMPTNPLDNTSEWKCSHCEFKTSTAAVRKILALVQCEIDQLDEMEPSPESLEQREALLKKYRSVFHPKHSLLISLKHSLAQLYGRVEGYTMEDLPDIILERKTEFCREIMKILDVITPGESRMRGMMMYDLHAPVMYLARNEFKCGIIHEDKLKERLQEPIKLLQVAAKILKREDPKSPEGIMGDVAEQSMLQLQASVDSLTTTG